MDDLQTQSVENSSTEQTAAPQLMEIELRVLGVLMEKQLTTPDAYPLTLNSIITACNQKSSREPISNYQQGEVARALQALEERDFIRKQRGSRSDKYEQQFMNQLNLGKKQQAVLCVMMLRGPQTISELNTRTQRMCDFVDKEDLELCVDRLSERETPYTVRLGHQPGQRGERIGHLFSGMPTVYPKAITSAVNSAANSADNAAQVLATTEQTENVELLEMEVASLTEKINSLTTENATLKQQVATLYKLTGHSMENDQKNQY